ncbi:sorbosone dehydrogenase family protein [Thalassobacillus sp. CUG 92003]|uniref:PQQ-dependent sugar dehydrogenase n=1 Tax=Thalassobacillus sp. CUG 92003 TaxID=2736641 RepID=UPI0015E76655|nr:PQQ-dependent sugar dehydrogenase [Thalassobacillus sp. CUG 92003]
MKYLFLVFAIALLSECTSEQEPSSEPSDEQADDQDKSALISQLNSPWDIESAEGTFFISEREGSITRWEEGTDPTRMDVETSKDIAQIGEGGLLGLALFPDFSESRKAYAYHTYNADGGIMNRVVVLEMRNNVWEETETIIEGIPGSNFHNGGRMKIGPDEKLYVTTGDAQEQASAQDKTSLSGNILRLNQDGSIPEDNPDSDSYVYSYGHRNPQGLTWADNGKLYASEHGSTNHDEVNQIKAGANYGWPEIEGDEEAADMETPLYQTGNDTWAPSGMTSQNNTLYVAALRGEAIYQLPLDDSEPERIVEDYGRIRDVEWIDGALYFITNSTDGRGSPEEGDDQLVRAQLQ